MYPHITQRVETPVHIVPLYNFFYIFSNIVCIPVTSLRCAPLVWRGISRRANEPSDRWCGVLCVCIYKHTCTQFLQLREMKLCTLTRIKKNATDFTILYYATHYVSSPIFFTFSFFPSLGIALRTSKPRSSDQHYTVLEKKRKERAGFGMEQSRVFMEHQPASLPFRHIHSYAQHRRGIFGHTTATMKESKGEREAGENGKGEDEKE